MYTGTSGIQTIRNRKRYNAKISYHKFATFEIEILSLQIAVAGS
jgi:hypothetical protein